jgi:predicted nucleic acid-binding protein
VTRALLDINVLIAPLDIDHERARGWIDAEIGHGWTSCAITQNGSRDPDAI